MTLDGHTDPDYSLIEAMFIKAAEKSNIKIDWVFDWYDNSAEKSFKKENVHEFKS